MPTLLSTLTFPFILLVSFPLAAFAIWTTTLALIILSIRVSVVYAELFAALLQAYLLPFTLPKSNDTSPSTPLAKPHSSPPSRHSSRSSSLGSGILHHRTPNFIVPGKKSQSSATLVNGSNGIRDYESVGGWRLQGEDEEEALWMSMNSRLQLPSSRTPSHRGSWIIGLASGQVSPELVRTPRPTASPESYFGGMTQVEGRGSRVSFEVEERGARSLKGSGSSVSLRSGKVMQKDG